MFAGVLGRRGFRRWRDRFGFLLLVLLGSWAGGVWLVAFGPVISGTHWLPFLIAGIMVALLALALMQLPKFRGLVYTSGQDREPAARLAIGLYFSITFATVLRDLCSLRRGPFSLASPPSSFSDGEQGGEGLRSLPHAFAYCRGRQEDRFFHRQGFQGVRLRGRSLCRW